MKYEKLHICLATAYLTVCCFLFGEVVRSSEPKFLEIFFFISTLIFAYLFYDTRRKHIKQREQSMALQLANREEHKKNIATREFIHQYKSNLIALGGLAEQSDLLGLKQYIQSLEAEFKYVLDKPDYFSLELVKDPALYRLMVSEFQYAEQQGVKLSFITNEIDDYQFRTPDLVSIVSVLCNNAIEAAACSKARTVEIRIFYSANNVEFIFSNSVDHEVDVSNIFQEGYSTKLRKSGIGLSYVKRILTKYERADYFVECSDGIFLFHIIIPLC